MKASLFPLFLVFAALALSSCEDDPCDIEDLDYSKQVTVKQGVWGSCIYKEGDFMPGTPTGTACGAKRTISFFELTHESEATESEETGFYTEIHSTLVGQTESDELGFYEIALSPGDYSVFIHEEGMYYSNSWDSQRNLSPVTVTLNTATEVHLTIDHKAFY